MHKILRLILGDQLNSNHSWFQEKKRCSYLCLNGSKNETNYVNHHIQKVAGIFASMRNFASELTAKKHDVIYIKINDKNNLHSFDKNIKHLINQYQFTHFEYQLPDEYRVDQDLQAICKTINISSNAYDTEHFLSERNELATFFENKRFFDGKFLSNDAKKHHVLMEGDIPLTGKWNYDSENRKKLPKNHVPVPPYVCNNDVSEIVESIHLCGITTIGTIDAKNFIWPTTRKQSIALLDFFVNECLALLELTKMP